jgi:hypothetical protein
VNDCCLALNEQFCSYVMVKTSYIVRDDNDIRFQLDMLSEPLQLNLLFSILFHVDFIMILQTIIASYMILQTIIAS